MKNTVLVFLFLSGLLKSQNTYIDPTVTAALILASENLKAKQNETNEKTKKLKEAQDYVAAQMVVANKIQDKILYGLREASGTLQNGIQIKDIYEDLNRAYAYAKDVGTLAAKHPQYAIFATKVSEKTYQSGLKIVTDCSDILKSGDLNLATAGDRYRLLFNISENVKQLKIWILSIKLRLEEVDRIGFWNALNPFSTYINTDKSIVEHIMRQYKGNY